MTESQVLENVQPGATFVPIISLFCFSIISTDCCYYLTPQTRGTELLHHLTREIRQISGGRAGKPQPELDHHPSDDQPRPLTTA